MKPTPPPSRTPFKVIIPARYASVRLPGKPLKRLAGKPIIQHVYERARLSGAAAVIIATDDERVGKAAERFGAKVSMTSSRHRSGTERVAEVARRLGEPDQAIIVNLQGDEALMPPSLIGRVAEDLALHGTADVSTLCERIKSPSAVFDPNVVKVVLDRDGNALYFSRAPVPWHREQFAIRPKSLPTGTVHLRHIGLYAYRAGYLQRYVTLEPSPLEVAESLEQLRVLHHGGTIHVAEAPESPGPGIDTPQDLERAQELMAEPVCQ